MSFNIYTSSPLSSDVTSVSGWSSTYKNTFLNQSHDKSQLNIILPDDCLVVIGPPRLGSSSTSTSDMYPVGFLQSIQYSETRQVQPLKTIGSRRHIFAATNSPVQGSIARILFLGDNLLYILHKNQSIPSNISSESNNTYKAGTVYGATSSSDSGTWYTNIEEDLFRIPFGMGIIYNAPTSLSSSNKTAADYIEGCVLTGRQTAIQSGQAMIMEQVSFMADRVVGWSNYSS